MPTTNLEFVVGAPVLAEAEVMSADARARLKAAQLGPPLNLLVKTMRTRQRSKTERQRPGQNTTDGPEACVLAVTEQELVAVATESGWRRNTATSVLTRVERASIVRASLGTGERVDMVIYFVNGDQWRFEVLRGSPRRACERVIAARVLSIHGPGRVDAR